MSDLKLGNLIEGEAQRDAIHIAVAPVKAGESLMPGEHVGLDKSGEARITGPAPWIGVVDPYLKRRVQAGEKFWLFLYPGTITGLRHEWAHPEFTKAVIAGVSESEQWIRDYCTREVIKYEDLIYHASDYLERNEYWVEGGRFEGTRLPEEFWTHYEVVTGATVPENKRGSFFSCSC